MSTNSFKHGNSSRMSYLLAIVVIACAILAAVMIGSIASDYIKRHNRINNLASTPVLVSVADCTIGWRTMSTCNVTTQDDKVQHTVSSLDIKLSLEGKSNITMYRFSDGVLEFSKINPSIFNKLTFSIFLSVVLLMIFSYVVYLEASSKFKK